MKTFQGHGYAGEVLSAIIDHTFINTDFVRLEAYHRAENIASGRVLLKSLMRQTDTVERFKREGVAPKNKVCYSIEYDEWRSERKI